MMIHHLDTPSSGYEARTGPNNRQNMCGTQSAAKNCHMRDKNKTAYQPIAFCMSFACPWLYKNLLCAVAVSFGNC
eukprot:6211921-Pleurochrysis_carterae.AAC.3